MKFLINKPGVKMLVWFSPSFYFILLFICFFFLKLLLHAHNLEFCIGIWSCVIIRIWLQETERQPKKSYCMVEKIMSKVQIHTEFQGPKCFWQRDIYKVVGLREGDKEDGNANRKFCPSWNTWRTSPNQDKDSSNPLWSLFNHVGLQEHIQNVRLGGIAEEEI